MKPRHAVALGGFLALLAGCFAVDRPIARLMDHVGGHIFDLFTIITWFGQGGVVLYPAALTGFAALGLSRLVPRLPPARRLRLQQIGRGAAIIFAVVAGAGLVNDLLKILFGRARPRLWLDGDDSGFTFLHYSAKFASFPSGHTATSVAAAIVFSAMLPRFWPVFAGLATLIAASRIVLDAHYLSDVVAGAAVGALTARLILSQMRRRGWTTLRIPGDFVNVRNS